MDGKRGRWVTMPNKVRLFIPEGSTVEAEAKKLKDSGTGKAGAGFDKHLGENDATKKAFRRALDRLGYRTSKHSRAILMPDGVEYPHPEFHEHMIREGLENANLKRPQRPAGTEPGGDTYEFYDVMGAVRIVKSRNPKAVFFMMTSRSLTDSQRKVMRDTVIESGPGTEVVVSVLKENGHPDPMAEMCLRRYFDTITDSLDALSVGRFRPRPGERPDAGGYWGTTDTGRRYRIREGDDVEETVSQRMRQWESQPGGGNPKKTRPAGSGDSGDSDGDERTFRRRHAGGKRALARSPLKGATWSHRMGGLMTIKDRQSRKEFASAYSKNGQRVYVIATTNNTGPFDRSTENEYVRLGTEGHEAVMGKWVNEEGTEYNDISMVKSGIGVEEALRFKRRYDQDEILWVDVDGKYDFI